MNIFVVATALQAGGGITIYKQFLSHLPKYIGEDKYWIFVNPILPKVKIEGVTYVISPLQSKVKRILSEGKFLVSEIERMKVNLDIIISLQNNGFKDTSNQKSSSSQSNYYEDDHLSCEQLKAKYPEMSDGELFERFGERGDNGIMYNGKHVWEDRGDGRTYSGHPI